MAVQAQYLDRAFRHDHRAVIRSALDDDATGASSSVFLGDHLLLAQLQSRGNTVFSDLTCGNNNNGCFVPRKRARVADVDAGACRSLIMDGHGGASLLPLPQAFTAPAAGDAQGREHCSGAATTSGASQGILLSQLHRHAVEIDALVRIENERIRAGLETARRRHARAVVSAVERAAARLLRTAEADLARAHHRTAELEERLRQTAAEGEACRGVASDHEATAAGLRATIDQLMQQPPCAEDAQSCCLEQDRAANQDGTGTRPCRECGEAAACVLLLPCRHLCLCAGCEAAVDACPVCAATKNASLHVLFT